MTGGEFWNRMFGAAPRMVECRDAFRLGTKLLCGLAALSCFLLLTLSAARAATLVEPGKPVIVETTDKTITEQKARFGTLSLVQGKPTGSSSLIYLAPETGSGLSDTVTYKLDSVEQTVEIEVRSGAQTFGSDELYETSFKALFVLFILAVLVESGLQLIFRWRPYLRVFDTSAVNALIALAFSWFFVGWFKLDIATKLVNAYAAPDHVYANSTVGYLLTAMIIAGGSAGVNNIFKAFGIRPIGPPADIAGPKDDKIAWISVTLHRDKAVGSVDVLFGEPGKEAVIGTIPGSGSNHPLARLFFRNKGRFPQSGGYTVDASADTPKSVKLNAKDAGGKDIAYKEWGPYPIGPRAIIDVERTV